MFFSIVFLILIFEEGLKVSKYSMFISIKSGNKYKQIFFHTQLINCLTISYVSHAAESN